MEFAINFEQERSNRISELEREIKATTKKWNRKHEKLLKGKKSKYKNLLEASFHSPIEASQQIVYLLEENPKDKDKVMNALNDPLINIVRKVLAEIETLKNHPAVKFKTLRKRLESCKTKTVTLNAQEHGLVIEALSIADDAYPKLINETLKQQVQKAQGLTVYYNARKKNENHDKALRKVGKVYGFPSGRGKKGIPDAIKIEVCKLYEKLLSQGCDRKRAIEETLVGCGGGGSLFSSVETLADRLREWGLNNIPEMREKV